MFWFSLYTGMNIHMKESNHMSQYDVIIVGAGSMGMAAGYYLSRTNQKILLLDAHNQSAA